MTAECQEQRLPRIFVSYKWDNTQEIVREIAEYLENTGKFEVWIDIKGMFGDLNKRMEEV